MSRPIVTTRPTRSFGMLTGSVDDMPRDGDATGEIARIISTFSLDEIEQWRRLFNEYPPGHRAKPKGKVQRD